MYCFLFFLLPQYIDVQHDTKNNSDVKKIMKTKRFGNSCNKPTKNKSIKRIFLSHYLHSTKNMSTAAASS